MYVPQDWILSSFLSLALLKIIFIFYFFYYYFFSLEMMTKFNQEMYARTKEKKNEPLSNIG